MFQVFFAHLYAVHHRRWKQNQQRNKISSEDDEDDFLESEGDESDMDIADETLEVDMASLGHKLRSLQWIEILEGSFIETIYQEVSTF